MTTLKDLSWGVPRANQGQIVEVAYAWGEDGTKVYRRVHDRSDGSTRYEVADLDWEGDEVYTRLEGVDFRTVDRVELGDLCWEVCHAGA